MLILSPRSACTATHHTQPSAPMPRGRPARAHAPAVKSDLYSWESISRGKLEMGSAPPWVHFLTILCTVSGPSRLFLSPCRYVRAARTHTSHSYISLIHLTHVHVHVTRCASSTMDVASSAWLLEQGTTCPLCCRLPHPITSPRTLHMTRSYLATGADLPMVVLLYY